MKRFVLLLTTLLFTVGLATAQTRVVKGNVTCIDDGDPLIGASVVLKTDVTKGTVTDVNGDFTLVVPANAKSLIVSYVGMIAQEVAITSNNLKIILKSDAKQLEQVVVTGYTTTSKKAFTGAASSVGSETVKAKFDANPINALNGNVAGVQMSMGSGQPGAPTTVYIRGRNSINSGTQPLYVIDGVPIETTTMGVRSSSGVSISPLSTISSDDILSVTVLKDATATSIYGARAANGVIVITTKRGQAGFKVNFSTRLGGATMPFFPHNYDLVNAQEYKALAIEGVQNGIKYKDVVGSGFLDNVAEYGLSLDGNKVEDIAKYLEMLTRVKNIDGPGTNWIKEVTRPGMLQNYSLDISGGSANPIAPRYFLSFDYLNEVGIVIGKDLQRYAMRANLEQAPNKYFKYGMNTSLSLTETNMGNGGGYFSDPLTSARMQSPMSPVYNPDGSFNLEMLSSAGNPVARRSKLGDRNEGKQYRALISPFATIQFTDWLSFTSRYGLDAYILDEFGYWSKYGSDGKKVNGLGENSTTFNFYQTITNTFNVRKDWDATHYINFLIGQEGQKTLLKQAYLEGKDYPVDDLVDVTLAAKPGEASTDRSELRLLSYLSNAEYHYLNRYYLSGSLRADASSRFAAKNRWGVFYSVGAKWALGNEEFFAPARKMVQDLTLRSSYGTSGNQAVGSGWYAGRGFYDFGYNYNNTPGSILLQFDNPDLKWEQTAKFNVGVDTRLFDRINLSLDYYYHKTKDMVFEQPLSQSVGIASYYRGVAYYKNIGELSNQGVEFMLGIDAVRTDNVNLNFAFTGAYNRNRVEKLASDLPLLSGLTITKPGESINTWNMKEWAGVDPETGVGLWYKNTKKEDGSIDRSITKNYNEAEKVILGRSTPDFIGGIKTTLKVYNFDLGLQLNYAVGGKIYGNNLHYDEQVGGSFGNPYTYWVAENRWKQPGDNAKVPMLVDSPNKWNSASSRFLMNGNYLKIQNLTLGYNFNGEWVKSLKLSNIRLFAAADNLYTFMAKDFRGYDPASIGSDGVQWWNYPQPFKFNAGFTLSF